MGLNKNLYRKDFYRHRKGILIWGGVLFVITALLLGIFPLMSLFGDEMSAMVEGMDEEMGGMNETIGYSSAMWTDVLVYYGQYYAIYIIMILAIFASLTSANILSKEEKTETSEFLYTRPLTRGDIYWSKFAAMISLVLFVFIFQTLLGWGGVELVKSAPISHGTLYTMNVHGFGLIIFFALLSYSVPILLNIKKGVIGMILGLIFGMLFIHFISMLAESVNWLGYISPFHYLDVSGNAGIEIAWLPLTTMLLLGVGLVFMASKKFENKDIAG